MLIPITQSRFIEKILTDSFGRQYRVLFAVSFVDGEIKGRVISATLIQTTAQLRGDSAACRLTSSARNDSKAFFLPGSCAQINAESESLPTFETFASPYFSLEYLLNSQPTRAPSHK